MTNHSRTSRFLLRSLLAAGLACGLSGCNNAGQGFISGGTLGALGGMAIGSTQGHMGSGAAIGAVIGAIGGAVIGDQNARNSNYSSYSGSRPGSADGQWVYVGGSSQWAWQGNRCCR